MTYPPDLLEPARVVAALAIDLGTALVPVALVALRCVGSLVLR